MLESNSSPSTSPLLQRGYGNKNATVAQLVEQSIRNYEQMILEFSEGDYISAAIDLFLIDRDARELSQPKLSNKPKLYHFRRAFALNMLHSGVDIFVPQRLMGHADLQVLRRYLAQNDEDNQRGHMRGSPVDNNL